MKKKITISDIFIKFQLLPILLILFDQLTKLLFRSIYTVGEPHYIIKGFFSFKLAFNTGAAWSILSDKTWLLAIFSLLACAAIEYYIFKFKPKNKVFHIILLVLLAGAFGNMIDRLFLNQVTDFISFEFGSYEFPTFNVADICVCLSCIGLLVYSLFYDKDKKEKTKVKELDNQTTENQGESHE